RKSSCDHRRERHVKNRVEHPFDGFPSTYDSETEIAGPLRRIEEHGRPRHEVRNVGLRENHPECVRGENDPRRTQRSCAGWCEPAPVPERCDAAHCRHSMNKVRVTRWSPRTIAPTWKSIR